MDKIVYTISDYGVDGLAPEFIEFASFDEEEVDKYFKNLKYPMYYSKRKRIINVENATKQAMARIDGLDRHLLNLEPRILPKKGEQSWA